MEISTLATVDCEAGLLEGIRSSLFLDHEPNMDDMFRVSLDYVKQHLVVPEGLMLEFGVFDGKSINRIADHWPEKTIWGFDSFEGLPEDWDLGSKIYKKKTKWHLKGSLPVVRSNVRLVKGFFSDSLPTWWEENKAPIGFLHVDCDLYSSTQTVLETLNDCILPGTIIRLDDLIDFREFENYEGKGSEISQYTTWREHEWKAFVEWINRHGREIEPLCRGWFQWAVVRVVR
ncbi:TylF/MycF/NovP-related O-methyltransferase [Pirellulaceae bacterium SH449]